MTAAVARVEAQAAPPRTPVQDSVRAHVVDTVKVLGRIDDLIGSAHSAEYFYTSRLQGEPAGGVGGVHAHPVGPRQLRVAVEWGF